jgi:hypothetical protein
MHVVWHVKKPSGDKQLRITGTEYCKYAKSTDSATKVKNFKSASKECSISGILTFLKNEKLIMFSEGNGVRLFSTTSYL